MANSDGFSGDNADDDADDVGDADGFAGDDADDVAFCVNLTDGFAGEIAFTGDCDNVAFFVGAPVIAFDCTVSSRARVRRPANFPPSFTAPPLFFNVKLCLPMF